MFLFSQYIHILVCLFLSLFNLKHCLSCQFPLFHLLSLPSSFYISIPPSTLLYIVVDKILKVISQILEYLLCYVLEEIGKETFSIR